MLLQNAIINKCLHDVVLRNFFEATLIVCALLKPVATAVGIVTHLIEKQLFFVLPYNIHYIWGGSP